MAEKEEGTLWFSEIESYYFFKVLKKIEQREEQGIEEGLAPHNYTE